MTEPIYVKYGRANADLKLGQRYQVDWHDCCTTGRFFAVLERIEYNSEGDIDWLVFDNGARADGVTLLEVNDAETATS